MVGTASFGTFHGINRIVYLLHNLLVYTILTINIVVFGWFCIHISVNPWKLQNNWILSLANISYWYVYIYIVWWFLCLDLVFWPMLWLFYFRIVLILLIVMTFDIVKMNVQTTTTVTHLVSVAVTKTMIYPYHRHTFKWQTILNKQMRIIHPSRCSNIKVNFLLSHRFRPK